jgi:hypothetical protein
MDTVTVTHPKNLLCQAICKALEFFGVNAWDSKLLSKTETIPGCKLEAFVISDNDKEFLSITAIWRQKIAEVFKND